ncbi:MAG: beta-lactamase family protein [Bacilli bacterium]|nr:beta-lactamase family protein [Bacilli bacterium]
MKRKLTEEEYKIIIERACKEVIENLDTEEDKEDYKTIMEEITEKLLETMDWDPKDVINYVVKDYIEQITAIAKLSPGLETGLIDTKYGITFNTIIGKTSDIENAEDISEDTVFDVSSMTKFFTSVLLLKEAEEGKIDLNKKFSEYSKVLEKMDESIIKALKFGTTVRTDELVAKDGLSKEERLKALLSAHTLPGKAFEYNDIQYMLVPFLFSDDAEEATEIYLKKFYSLYKGIGLSQTGYSTINMSGGNVTVKYDENGNEKHLGLEIFDPKAHKVETEIGLVPTHAGVTSSIIDLEKLFIEIENGLLNEESIKSLITTITNNNIYLLDENNEALLNSKGEKIKVNHAMGVFPHVGDVRICDIADGPSKDAFVIAGSTGSWFTFDKSNGLAYGYLPNIRSGLYPREIDVDYPYGTEGDEIPFGKNIVHLGSAAYNKGSMEDGKLERGEGKPNMPFTTETNHFKRQQFEIIIKLRIAKLSEIVKAHIENDDKEYEKICEIIEKAFNNKKYQKIDKKEKNKSFIKI